MNRLKALSDLSAALRGNPRADSDWMAVIALANQALVTPQIHAACAAAGTQERLPDDVRTFTGEVLTRNRERNRRLFDQLHDALLALNAAAIEPLLLKGAGLWAALGRPERFDRMLNDLDLLVRPEEAPRAVEALTGVGFELSASYGGDQVHVVAELGRPEIDVGFIDLHQRAPGPPGLAERAAAVGRTRLLEWEGVRARVPEPALQLFFLALHDQFHEGGYWRGGITLRHLLDIAALTGGPEPLDWTALDDFCRTRLTRNALDAQLVAARRYAGAKVPEAAAGRAWARLQHARQLAQFAWPALAAPLAGLAMLSEAGALVGHRRFDAADRRRLFGPAAKRSLSDRLERLREMAAPAAPGRV